jgi:hypothetical protein
MRLVRRVTALVGLSVTASAATAPVTPAFAQQTRAERSKYQETSTYSDVIAFIDALQARGAKIRVGSIGKSPSGRDIPYIIASRPLVTTPLEAKRLGRPIVYIQGNIHAGEVEGKEALQAVLRDLLFDKKKNALDSIVLVAVPIYNTDGNEAFKPQAQNRGSQNGPEMVGQRPNGMQLDLNRDYVKAEAPETRGSLAMFNAWDPDLFVDLHTTDGSFHGYALTYSPSLHPAAGIIGGTFGGAFVRDSMLPVLRTRMRTRHKFEVFDYGNFTGDEGPAAAGEAKSWSTYEHKPRYGTNYYGLRGRLSILSEAYSHDPFERRVKSTDAFIREILSLTSERAKAVLALTRASDAALSAGTVTSVPIRAVMTKTPSMQIVIEEPLEQIAAAKGMEPGARGRGAGPGLACQWPLTEPGVRCGMKRSGKMIATKMPVKDRFDATLSVKLPVAYLIPKNASSDSVIGRLRSHGVVVEQLTGRLDANGLIFAIDSLVRSGRPFQGHSEVRLEGRWYPNDHVTAEPGAYLVRTSQPLGVLAAMLLEPQSDDGLVTWNFLDVVLDPMMKQLDPDGHNYPILRITQSITAPTRIIP